MGSAWVWIPYMKFLAKHGITSHAVSTRGHGESWHSSSFLRMVFDTTKRMLGDDLVAGIMAVQEKEGSEVVVGHSSGGGLSQFIVNEGDVKVKALGLIGAVPGTGSYVILSFSAFAKYTQACK
jgi:pimeloyl-ACP methyl ester carboxylesterase